MSPDARRDARRVRVAFFATLALVGIAAVLVATVVDLEPKVESDFFFSSDDPQLRASQRVGELFPSGEQILVGALAPDIDSEEYVERIGALSEALAAIDGVASVRSLTSGPSSPAAVAESPLWHRLLLGENPRLSQLVVSLETEGESGADARSVVESIETLLELQERPSFQLDASGVPWVVEQIRRALGRDLRVFSTAALLAFGLLVAIVYRSPWIVAGTLVSCLGACAVTLAILWAIGSPIGLLTANIVTLVFVLTLSHLVFLTANWRRALADHGAPTPAATPTEISATISAEAASDGAVVETLQASIWCMVTTLLGFASLLFASAKPLRELGLAGAIGTAVAIVVAYGLYPGVLRRLAGRSADDSATKATGVASRSALSTQTIRRLQAPVTIGLVALALVAALGVPRLDTDPNLLSYFAEDSELYRGLERIDRHGGSSPLDLVVRHPDGERLDTKEAQERMLALQESLEADPQVASSLSLPVLLSEAQRAPMAFLLSFERLLDLLESPRFDRVASSFVTEDRLLGRYFLRLHEADLDAPRRAVIERLEAKVADAGLELETTGGLYELQASLGELVRSSVVRGLGGLFVLFAGVAFVVSRSLSTAAAMLLGLGLVPVIVLGGFGLSGQPLDLISSPAANVAIALGIDSMIHLVTAVRRRLAAGDEAEVAWSAAIDRLWPAVLGATLILAAGFGLFALSSFPPTRRFGVAVALGTAMAAAVALFVLPTLARRLGRSES